MTAEKNCLSAALQEAILKVAALSASERETFFEFLGVFPAGKMSSRSGYDVNTSDKMSSQDEDDINTSGIMSSKDKDDRNSDSIMSSQNKDDIMSTEIMSNTNEDDIKSAKDMSSWSEDDKKSLDFDTFNDFIWQKVQEDGIRYSTYKRMLKIFEAFSSGKVFGSDAAAKKAACSQRQGRRIVKTLAGWGFLQEVKGQGQAKYRFK